MLGNLEGRAGGDLGSWKIHLQIVDLRSWKINLQPIAFPFLGLEIGADGNEQIIEEVEVGVGGLDEGKGVFYQLHVGGGALAQVTVAAVCVPRHLGHEQVPLQGALEQEVVEAGKDLGKGEGGVEVKVGDHQGHQLYRKTVQEGGKVIKVDLSGSFLILGVIIKRCL